MPENPKPPTTPEESTANQTPQEKVCHIHDELPLYENKDKILKNVCVPESEHPLTEFEGKHYCLFHLPTMEKDIEKFKEIFQTRLEKTDNQCAAIEAEFPNDEENQNKVKLASNRVYDFRYVWFPTSVDLHNQKFSSIASFNFATFNGYTSFNSATFSAGAYFFSTIFNISADFSITTFNADVYFSKAIFSADAYSSGAEFGSAKFNGTAEFGSAKFNGTAEFGSAKFNGTAEFGSAKFNGKAEFGSAKFNGTAKFGSAKFNGTADFSSAKFIADADFGSAKFIATAFLKLATFIANASFSKTTFSTNASFNLTNFGRKADFKLAIFQGKADFKFAIFQGKADFKLAAFDEKSQIYFLETLFCSKIEFNQAEVSGYVEFEGDVFCNAEKSKEIKTELKPPIYEDQEAILDFQEIRLRNPERVSFNSTKLHPNWFVNVAEARKIEFNDVEWLNSEIDIDRTGLDEEIKSLKKRRVSRAERSLIKACNQLADNAEANRRFEEAERFRKQSIALEKKPCHIHDETDPRKKDDIREKVCQEYPVINEVGGNYYCLLHNPDHNKSEIFLKEFEKLKAEGHTDFRAVVFPITVEFVFPITDKKRGKVPDLDFSGATFLRRVVFDNAEINNLNFTSAFFTDISELVIKNSKCNGEIKFDKADIEGKLFIVGEYKKGDKERRQVFLKENNGLSMKDARIDKPHWINFRTINLLPHYFTEVDVSKIIFQDCKWRDNQGNNFDTQKEIDISNYKEIAQTCNQLAINYEENRKYEESSVFRYAAMEANRRGYPSRFKKIFNLYWLYKWTSGYGERRLWATFVLILLVAFFGILYATPFAKFEGIDNTKSVESVCSKYWIIGNQEGMRVCDGMIHSLAVASFQRPDPKPKDSFTKFLVTLETILAPLQAALLALAIRRKFMR